MRQGVVGMMLVSVLSLAALVRGDSVNSPSKAPSPVEMAELFLDAVAAGKIDGAFDTLLAGSPLLQQGSSVDMLKAQAKAQLPLFGEVLRRESIDRKDIGTAVVVLKYVVHQEKEPMTWGFVFYKPRDRWLVTSMRWTPSLEYLK